MSLLISIYGKGGIGKSTITSNLSISFAKKGKKVLQVGCDPKHDSTFPITHSMILTTIEVLKQHDFHEEEVTLKDIVFTGYMGVDCVEAGGPPAGTGCAGYVIGETIKLLENLSAYENYDIVLFDVLGDVVCGGFSVPLQYSQRAMVVATDDFDSLFAANRIINGIYEKSHMYPVRLSGIIGNRYAKKGRVEKFAEEIKTSVITNVPHSEDIKSARVSGKSIYELYEMEPEKHALFSCFDKITDYILNDCLKEKEPVCGLSDREMFERYKENINDKLSK
ncbi:MAG: hypothetical protein ACD_79C00654G0004 [uncultured bacterium]|nr:MAG: hypothetical protein ACD_79C00654G0004 [uncultured bacterium]